jgi:hypothetical protein
VTFTNQLMEVLPLPAAGDTTVMCGHKVTHLADGSIEVCYPVGRGSTSNDDFTRSIHQLQMIREAFPRCGNIMLDSLGIAISGVSFK